jgi:hypothetical protein
MLAAMATITITVSDHAYAWLTERARTTNSSVEAVLEDQVERLPEVSRVDPALLAIMESSIERNRNLYRRLAQ